VDAKDLDSISEDLKKFTSIADLRLRAIEQKMTAPTGMLLGSGGGGSDIARKVIDSEAFKSFVGTNKRRSERIDVGTFFDTKTLVNATGLNQPLVPGEIRPGIVAPGQQQLTVSDLLPHVPTSSNMVEFARENSHTDNTQIQATEGDVKGENALGFELAYSPVRTIAAWIAVSTQILSDAQALQNYIDSRLRFFNGLKVENEILNGSGVGSEILGLIPQASTFDSTRVNPATDSFIDVLGLALTQASESYFSPDAIILNVKDWSRIQRIKTSTFEYVYSDPHAAFGNQLWGTRVVPSWNMPESQFLVGSFSMGGAIWDRQQATVEISREHSDFFTRNLAAILCESRLALTVYRPTAFVYGGIPFGS
jgi:HK97 family phage major capsid protein